ncbi:hypothetical protein [Phormidesmis priestleyi]|uniref:hypothetical protein n=1 Tax=Phormidesmis priestleyi TaxID=268141 RepID=UPI00083A5410|nr:hypothetical protein [Phormidesmis priestleyi]
MADHRALPPEQTFSEIVRRLEQDANAARIKKLILYACKNWWENDPDRLSVISLQSLVQELRYLNPTLEHLKYKLHLLVGTLSKQEEYLQVATTIIENLTGLYRSATPIEKTTINTNPLDAIGGKLQNQITKILEQEVHSSRIKKLMIYAARKHWEADPLKIDQAEINRLISELAHQYPTIESLQIGLAAIVKSLNKPIEYAAIANMILREMGKLYSQEGEVISPESTNDLATQAVAPPSSQTAPAIELFDMRLEIVKFANPLRAKILLFSLVYYPFTYKEQDWSNLKLYSLEGLLRSVTTVCHSLEDLQSNLEVAAQQLNPPEDYVEVVRVILKSLKPGYISLQQHVQQALQITAEVTRANSTQVLISGVPKSSSAIGNQEL